MFTATKKFEKKENGIAKGKGEACRYSFLNI
jgi:hypothetical protein